MLDQATVDDEGWALGDTVTVLGAAGPAELTDRRHRHLRQRRRPPRLVSLVAVERRRPRRRCSPSPAPTTCVVVAGDGSVTPDELATRIDAAVGSDEPQRSITGEADTADNQAEFKEDLSFFNTFLLAFAYIALFVGMFIIYNTFSIVVAQRMREMAMLRAVGASRRQVLAVGAVRVGARRDRRLGRSASAPAC